MGGSNLKKHNFTSPRRRSSRLKAITAIYEAEEIANLHTKRQQQFSGGKRSTVANRIKVEVLEPEEGNCTSKSNEHVNDPTDSSYPEKHIHEETHTAYDDQSLNDMTLKDFRASCKSKKQKVPKSVASAEVGLKNCSHFDPSQKGKYEHVKPKQEEPDLEGPLVTLKVSKKSTADRKQKKHARLSPLSSGPIEVVTAKTCSLSSNDMHGSMPVAQMKASITERPSKDGAANLHDLKSEAETVEEDFGGSSKEIFIEVDHYLLSSTTYAGSSELACHFKTEIMEACSLDEQNTANIATNSTLDIISSCNFLDNSSAELLQKVGEGLNNCLPTSLPDLQRTLHVDRHELVYTIKREILENDSPLHENTIYDAASSTVDFIAKFNYSEKSSNEQFGRHEDDVLENGGSNSSSNSSTYSCLNAVSTEYIESDQCCLPESDEHVNEMRKMDLSEMSNQKLCPSLVSIHKAVPFDPCSSGPASMTIDIGADIPSASSRSSSRSMDIKVAEACASVLGHEDSQSLTHDLPVQQMPICSHIEDVTNDCSLLCKEHDLDEIFSTATEGECCNNSAHHTIAADERGLLCREHDLDEIFNTGIEGECLRNSAHHLVAGDEQISSNESTSTCIEEFSEAYKLYSPQPSCTCCGALDESSCKTEELSSKEEGHTEEETSYLVEISGVNDPEGLTRASDFRSPKISPPCFSTLRGLHCADSLSKAAGEFSSFGVEEKLQATKDQPASAEISQLIVAKRQSMQKELKRDKGLWVDQSPKKLLSNRKIISPTSQEKLCQALSDIDLYDASQLPSHKEAEALLAPKLMSKKPKNHFNGSLLLVNKGILKSLDASCRSPCSCMKSSTFDQQTEKAIEFSQRQMHDIENIAMKLLNGLKSMKNIVEETLCSESCSSLPSKFTADEIRAAAENASELEKTTRRWLSMMTKDCNRFCKIMRLAENKETTVNGVSKKRKKITFADEAGGVLCQVKVFRQEPAPVVVREIEKADISHVLL